MVQTRHLTSVAGSLLLAMVTVGVTPAIAVAAPPQAQGWQIPENGRALASPLKPTPDVLKKGAALYKQQCARCHGATGKGDGAEAEPGEPPANLTRAELNEGNTAGMLFYKVWNGRKSPLMPAFKSRMTNAEAWAVVEYIRTLAPQPKN